MPDQIERPQPSENPPWNQSGPSGQIPPTMAAHQSGPGWQTPSMVPPPGTPPPAESFGTFGSGGTQPPPPPLVNPYNVPPSPPQYPAAPPAYVPNYAPVYMPASVEKKPIYFPLTRHAPVLWQIVSMLVYSAITALSIMGCVLYLINSYHPESGNSIYTNLDGSVNVLAIVLTVVLVLLVFPLCSLLCGALFGSWGGVLVSVASLAGGIFLIHLVNNEFWSPERVPGALYAILAAFPVSALVVGLIYDQRKYAAWWKSMLTLMLGATVLTFWLSVALFIAVANNPSSFDSASGTSLQGTLAAAGVALGCVALLAIPLLTFPVAGIEGLIHAQIAAVRNRR